MIGLAAGLLAAWWQSKSSAQERSFILLLTHIEVRLGDVALDRHELTRLEIVLQPGHVHTLHFSRGQAPQSSAPQPLKLPADATDVQVRCRFQLPGGAIVRSQGSVPIPARGDRGSEEAQVFDLGTCGTAQP